MYHIIFVVKYRKPLLIKFGDFIKTKIMEYSIVYNFEILEIEIDKDHIHILIKTDPIFLIVSIIRILKQRTSYDIWKHYEDELKHHFWKDRTFWSKGYFECSIGNVSKDIIEKYIQEQG
jgi:putative transposase